MEHEILDTLDLLQTILQTIDEGIHAVDHTGKTIYYNEAAGHLDGLKPDEVIGKHVLVVFPSLAKESSTLLQVLETGVPIRNRPQTYTNYLGIQVHTLNTTLPILRGGNVIGAIEVSKDLTEVKRLSEQVLELQARVVQSTVTSSAVGRNSSSKQKMIRSQQFLLTATYTFADILTCSKAVQHLKDVAARAARSSSPVLIYGETGTGKELFVQAIHNASDRAHAPFLAQNCAALPSSLLESILFGTVRGSFTGAEDRPGLFELAHGGTLFLDEINSMPVELQAKLLRVLQDGAIRRVGATEVKRVDVRVMAATNVNPIQLVKEQALRSDLFYRLNVVSLALPKLIERKEDIPFLTQHFLQEWNHKLNKHVIGLDEAAKVCLETYDWPGNVRELAHVIEGAMNIVDGDFITLEEIPWYIKDGNESMVNALDLSNLTNSPNSQNSLTHTSRTSLHGKVQFSISQQQNQSNCTSAQDGRLQSMRLREALQALEEQYIQQAMTSTNGNIQQAARLLGIPRQTLQYKLEKPKK